MKKMWTRLVSVLKKTPPPSSYGIVTSDAATDFHVALTSFRGGRHGEAEALCRKILGVDSTHFGAMHLLGVLESQRGNRETAVEWIRRALAADAAQPEALNNLGSVLRTLNRLGEAEASLHQALALKPDFPGAYVNLGNVHAARGDAGKARTFYQKALEIQADNIEALNNLGNVYKEEGDLGQAEACYQKALTLAPRRAELHKHLGDVFRWGKQMEKAEEAYLHALELNPHYAEAYVNLGLIHNLAGRLDEAEACFRKAVAENRTLAEAYASLAEVLQLQNRYEEAESVCLEVLSFRPGHVDALNNLATVYKKEGKLDAAESYSNQALSLDPGHVGALCNLGGVFLQRGQLDEAEACYQKGLQLHPESETVKYNQFSLFLLRGEYRKGLAHYEYRQETFPAYTVGMYAVFRSLPRWRGEDLTGKTLLVWNEQGVGDEILFASVIPDVMRMPGQVVVECEPRLASLFAQSFPGAEIVARQELLSSRLLHGDIDYQLPAGSLAFMLRSSVENFPHHDGYLRPDPVRATFWHEWLVSLGDKPKVGISWRSMVRSGVRSGYYTELGQWGEILRTPGVVFVNLQYGECGAELEEAWQCFGVRVHQAPGLNLKDELDEAAALTKALDLVISPKTSVAAMAGAVGVPTWLLTLENDWTLLGTDHMPWYPDMKVYRKAWDASWDDMLARIAQDLAAMAK